jgi:hypothetical protein
MSEQKAKRPYRRRKAVEAPVEAPVEAAPVVAESIPEVPAGPRPMMLTAGELFQLKLAQADLRAATAEQTSERLKKLYVLAKIDPQGVVQKQEKTIAEREADLRNAQQKFASLRLKISSRLGMNIENCGIDMETGEVVPRPA